MSYTVRWLQLLIHFDLLHPFHQSLLPHVPLATTNLFLVSVNLGVFVVLDSTYKWYHMVFGFLWLMSFSTVLKFCFCKWWGFMSSFMAEEYSIVCLYVYKRHTVFIYSSIIDTGCFHILAIINNDAINLDVCLLQLVFLISSCKYWEADMLDHMLTLFLIFKGPSILFSIVAAPIQSNSIPSIPFSPHLHQHL